MNSLFESSGTSYPARLDGREYQSEGFASDGTTLIRREQINFANRAPVTWWTNPGDPSEPPNDVRATDSTTTLADVTPNLVTKKTFNYVLDSISVGLHNEVADIYEYDFGQGGAPTYPTRHTHKDYLITNNGVSYADPANSSSYTVNDVHMRGLMREQKIYAVNTSTGSETLAADRSYEFDNYTADLNHAALLYRSGISGLDSSFTTSYTTRGNVTATTAYILTNGQPPICSSTPSKCATGYAQYDIAGNVVTTIDALGHASTLDYRDSFGPPNGTAESAGLPVNTPPAELAGQASYGFPFNVTNALGQKVFTKFDYYLGRPVDAEDANGTTYSGYSTDSLDRPTQILRAANNASLKSQSTFAYNDTTHTVTVTSDQASYGDNLVKGRTIYDGLGRTIETRSYLDSTNYIAVQQVPFVMLADPDTAASVPASQSSDPFQPYLNGQAYEQPAWTTTFVNSFTQSTKVKTPDNAIVRTTHNGNTVTSSDQLGRARKSVRDALGRTTQVYEDPTGSNWLTIYEYDVLGGLLRVTQGTQQPRTFVHDSLNRMLSQTNPESGTICYGTVSNGQCQNDGYDKNGNLLYTTDARGVQATLAYDVLNRITSKNYQNDPNSTPAVNYFYDGQTLPNGTPTFTRGSSVGRLVGLTYGGGSAGDYFAYDALGHNTLKIQQTGGMNYQTSANYTIAGLLSSETYPSGRTVNYAYDQTGRTTSVTGSLGDGTTRNYSTGIVYSSLGTLKQEQFGTDTPVYNKLFYNIRGQLAEIRESTSANNTSWNRGAIINQYSNQCWGMCTGSNMTDNNGNLKRQDMYIPDNDPVSSYKSWVDGYSYDSANRLTQVSEDTGNPALNWQQTFIVDRWGNRTIDYNNTSPSIPRPQFNVDTGTNRLTVPNGQTGTMTYDFAGNLTNDTYSGQGQRNYDAENRMTKAWANSQWQIYTYDGRGRRVRRSVNNVETWEVYGVRDELVAEYAASGAALNPQKEYGYRNGQLLVTAEAPIPQNVVWTNLVGVSAAGNSLSKTASTSWGNAGASSTQTLLSGDGFVEMTVGELGHARIFGFSHTDTNQNWDTIDFGLHCSNHADNAIYVYESGIERGTFGGYAVGDKLRVSINGGVIRYSRNGAVFYTSTVTPTYPLRVDSALYENGAMLLNGAISGNLSSGGTTDMRWMVTDQLGTPRMIFDKTGSLDTMTRHDYLPFGEEVNAGLALRTTTQGYTATGYSAADKARHKFTQQERDNETGMDYMRARYYSNVQGRFGSADSVAGSIGDPQSLNRYSYVGNDPINYSDPTGHMPSYHTYAFGFEEPSGGGWGWDDPTSPYAVLEAAGGLPARYEEARSQLYARELAAVAEFNLGEALLKSALEPPDADITVNSIELLSGWTTKATKVADATLDRAIGRSGEDDYALDLNQVGNDQNGISTIAFTFYCKDKVTWDKDYVRVSLHPNGRWKLVNPPTTENVLQNHWPDATTAKIYVHVRLRDIEAANSPIRVSVGGNYMSLYRHDGRSGIESADTTRTINLRLLISGAPVTVKPIPPQP